MIAVEPNVFHDFLSKHDESQWADVLERLWPSIHPVDQVATKIWFTFWPLKLARELRSSDDEVQIAKRLQLDGKYRLEQQVDSSIDYFVGSRFWGGVKQAVLEYAESTQGPESIDLEKHIRLIASRVAETKRVEESFVVGITAVGVMVLQQVGVAALASSLSQAFEIRIHQSAEQLLRQRRAKSGDGLRGLLGLGTKDYRVTYDESQSDGSFRALIGQDLSMASATDTRNYKGKDHRKIAGPVPAECRSGACGYCWIGVIGGKENLSAVTEFERKRLRHFGYLAPEGPTETHPHVRLACQSKCYGNISIVVPPWNGVLEGR